MQKKNIIERLQNMTRNICRYGRTLRESKTILQMTKSGQI